MHRRYYMCISQAYMCIYSELCTMCAQFRTSLIFVYKVCTQFIFQQRDFLELCVHFSSLNCTLVQCTHKDILSEALFLPHIISSYNASSQLLNSTFLTPHASQVCVHFVSYVTYVQHILARKNVLCAVVRTIEHVYITQKFITWLYDPK